MSIVNAVMLPHPPLILPGIGRGEEKKIQTTIGAYASAAGFIAKARPDTIVILTPHSIIYYDYFHISPGALARGDFSRFGAEKLSCSVSYDKELVREICLLCAQDGFPAGTKGEKDASLDHATMIPLHFLKEAYGNEALPPIVRIGLSGRPLREHYKLGMMIREASDKLQKSVSVIASGDLSHRLKPDGPYGYKAEGPEYDKRIMQAMGSAAFGELFKFDESFCEAAGECGHRSFTIMAGCFDGFSVQAEKLSYEGPFGVGYGVCLFSPLEKEPSRCFLKAELAREAAIMQKRRENEDEYVRLARLAVETYVCGGEEAELPSKLSNELLSTRAGAFVSLHIDSQLRGCIGTTGPTADCLAKEIIQNGISACSKDPRFPAVTRDELPYLEYSVDVLGEAEDIDSTDELDVKRYGVIVSNGRRRGLLLPDLEGVDTIEEQIAIAKKKAGIREHENVRLQRFEVVRHV